MIEGWERTADRLLAGFAHNANGRTASLRGLVALIEGGSPQELWLPLLRDEAERMAGHSGGLHAVAPDLGTEPLDPRDLLALAGRALDALHVTLLPPELDTGVGVAVHASRTAFVRALLVAVLESLPVGTETRLHCRVERRAGRVVVRLTPAEPWEVGPLDGARALLAPYAGDVAAADGAIELTLPVLD